MTRMAAPRRSRSTYPRPYLRGHGVFQLASLGRLVYDFNGLFGGVNGAPQRFRGGINWLRCQRKKAEERRKAGGRGRPADRVHQRRMSQGRGG
jgi:hypothetical protein